MSEEAATRETVRMFLVDRIVGNKKHSPFRVCVRARAPRLRACLRLARFRGTFSSTESRGEFRVVVHSELGDRLITSPKVLWLRILFTTAYNSTPNRRQSASDGNYTTCALSQSEKPGRFRNQEASCTTNLTPNMNLRCLVQVILDMRLDDDVARRLGCAREREASRLLVVVQERAGRVVDGAGEHLAGTRRARARTARIR